MKNLWIHICLNSIVKWVQLIIQKLLKYEKSFVEINVFLILILSNRHSGTGGIQERFDSILPPNLIADMQVRWDAIY
jgi:hypothetical protein